MTPSISITGAQPMSRRAKAAYERVERQSIKQLRRHNPPNRPDPAKPRTEVITG